MRKTLLIALMAGGLAQGAISTTVGEERDRVYNGAGKGIVIADESKTLIDGMGSKGELENRRIPVSNPTASQFKYGRQEQEKVGTGTNCTPSPYWMC